MIIERIDKHCVLFSKDSSNGELAGVYMSKTNKIVKDLLNGIEPTKAPEKVEQVIEPTIDKPKRKRTRKKKVLSDET